MTAWDGMVAAHKHFAALSVACGFVAFACVVGALSGVAELRWPVIIFGLLSAHALTCWVAMGQITSLQAALDMKRFAFDAKETLVTQHIPLRFGAPDVGLRAKDGTEFRIALRHMDCASEQVELTVRYLG